MPPVIEPFYAENTKSIIFPPDSYSLAELPGIKKNQKASLTILLFLARKNLPDKKALPGAFIVFLCTMSDSGKTLLNSHSAVFSTASFIQYADF